MLVDMPIVALGVAHIHEVVRKVDLTITFGQLDPGR
jgi:hypothetical protein